MTTLAIPAVAPSNKNHTRTGIMKVIAPVIATAVKGIDGLDLTNKDAVRRTFRAILHVGVKLMLDAGAHPEVIAKESILAIQNELKERQEVAKQDGATQNAPSLPC